MKEFVTVKTCFFSFVRVVSPCGLIINLPHLSEDILEVDVTFCSFLSLCFELFLANFELLNDLTLEVVLGFGTALHTSRLTLNRLRPAAVALLFLLVLCLRVMKMGANGEKITIVTQ